MIERETFGGVKFSAGLLVLSGSLIGLFTLAGFAMTFLLGAKIQREPGSSSILFSVVFLLLLASFALVCFRVASSLYQLKRRARYFAIGIGLFLLTLGIWLVLDIYFPTHPERSTGDEGYVLLFCPFLILPGAWLALYLNLPHVYRQFNKQRN